MQLKSDGSLSLKDIQTAWSCVAANVIKKANEEYLAHLKGGKAKDVAMEKTSQSRFIAAKLHTFGYIFNMFREALDEMPQGEERKVLEGVCRLYGLWQIEEQQGYFLKCELMRLCLMVELTLDGYFTAEQMDKVQESVDALCLELRQVAGELPSPSGWIPAEQQSRLSTHLRSRITLSTRLWASGTDRYTSRTLPRCRLRTRRPRCTRTLTDSSSPCWRGGTTRWRIWTRPSDWMMS